MLRPGLLVVLVVCSAACSGPTPPRADAPGRSGGPPSSPADILVAIAREIAAIEPKCPQLAELDPDKHVDRSLVRLEYGYHTHRSKSRGGWTSGVPNPDPDGIWLYIDIHDPASMAQIHTQPLVPMLDVGGQRLMMLLLEGERVPSCSAKIQAILERYGRPPPGSP